MTYDEVFSQVVDLLQREQRVSYRALKRRFEVDDEYLEDLKAELIDAKRIAVDEDGKVLVWVGAAPVSSSESRIPSSSQSSIPNPQPFAERRQLTVMFCDLVGSTALSAQLDPEELREVVRGYQQTSAAVIERFGGHIAQYLGDGLLVYFGYPVAHEDDAARAVRAGLEIVQAIRGQGPGNGLQGRQQPLQVRIGIHTGPVVIGEMGGGVKREQLALGETPNLAARIQGQAAPDEVVISTATYRLVEGLFECEDRGQPELKGVSTPLTLYRVVKESQAQSRFEVVARKGLTPLIGRDHELGLLRERWARVKEGEGQVVLLSGEAGIGKSRLVQELKDTVTREGAVRIEFRCSPYHQHSAFSPILDHLQRLLQFAPEDTPPTKLSKLRQALTQYRFPQTDTLALLAAFLSLPHPDDAPPITVSPQKQKEKTQAAFVAWVVEEAERQAAYLIWEDLHWIDPSSLEVLTLILQQVPTSRVLVVLTYRPDFTPPWRPRAHSTQLTLNRLGRQHVTAMVNHVTAKAVLSAEVVQQIVSRTDGVPLFVEELTKTVLESMREQVTGDGGQERGVLGARHAAPSPLAIPATLQDSLMARLDRLGAAKAVAQLGATLGREFSYEVLQAVSPIDATALQHALQQLVDAELLYQRGVPPQATYLFKHALIQDTAYHSLLKSTRQQYHQQIAHALEEQFPQTKETQPELVAHHYTEAGLIELAIPYWQQAGQRAIQRSANVEAINYLTKGLELLKTLPTTPERTHQELSLQMALSVPLVMTKGYMAQEVEKSYARARELCQQEGETPQLFRVLRGLWTFHTTRAELQTARELGEQLLSLAQSAQDPAFLLEACYTLGASLFRLGEFTAARSYLEQGIDFYDPQQHRSRAGSDPDVLCLLHLAWTLWLLGYPDQALHRSHQALTLAQELSHPFSLAFALDFAAEIHRLRREGQAAQKRAEASITLSTERGFTVWLAAGTILRGWALAEQGQEEEGITQMHQGLTTCRVTGIESGQAHYLAMLAEAYGKVGQTEEGLILLTEALAFVDKTGERESEAELYRLKGTLTLEAGGWRLEPSPPSSQASSLKPPVSQAVAQEAEGYFQKALAIARQQQAKSLELRAATSLARLWQQQGKQKEAHQMLAEIYGWFTEGFDTKDLQEAKALLGELG